MNAAIVPQQLLAARPSSVMKSKVGIVTVLYNSATVLPGFFSSLAGQSVLDFHVWVVDNASKDNSVELCRAQGEKFTVIANDSNLGVAAGNNQGIYRALESGCEYILLLNNDVEFGSELIGQLLDGIEANHCSMTAPMIYYFDRPDIIWAGGGKFQPLLGYRCYHLYEGVKDRGQFRTPFQSEHAPTCCVLIAREVFDRIGFMDERYFVYHDDTDFMLRCWKKGERLFILPHAKLLHKVSSLTGGAETDFSIRMGTRNRIYLAAKFLGRILAAPYFVTLSLVYVMLRIAGRYGAHKYVLKQRSLREGYLMATNWFPYLPHS